jgi:hypothetical protein
MSAKSRERLHGGGKRLPHDGRQFRASYDSGIGIGAVCDDLNEVAQLVQHPWSLSMVTEFRRCIEKPVSSLS